MKDREGTELAVGDVIIIANPLRRMTITKLTPTRIAYPGEGYSYDRPTRQYVKVPRTKYVRPSDSIKVGHVELGNAVIQKTEPPLVTIAAIPQ